MKKIIVTVTDDRGRFAIDLELPTDVKMNKLGADIVEVLHSVDPACRYDPGCVTFLCSRTEAFLREEDTLEDAGVWNGDLLLIMRKRHG